MTNITSTDQNLGLIMGKVPDYFQAEKAEGLEAVVQFHLTGPQGGDWGMIIKDRQCRVVNGILENPRLIFSAETQDCLSIFNGEVDPMRAFMQGKLGLRGDVTLAMKMFKIFRKA